MDIKMERDFSEEKKTGVVNPAVLLQIQSNDDKCSNTEERMIGLKTLRRFPPTFRYQKVDKLKVWHTLLWLLPSPSSIASPKSYQSHSRCDCRGRRTPPHRPPPPKMCAHLGLITSNLYLPAGGTLLEDRPQSRSAIIRGGGEVGEREAARKEAQPSQR